MPTFLPRALVVSGGRVVPAHRHRAQIMADVLGDPRMFGDQAALHLAASIVEPEISSWAALDIYASNPNHDERGRFAGYGEAAAAAEKASDHARDRSDDTHSGAVAVAHSAMDHAKLLADDGEHAQAAAVLGRAGRGLAEEARGHADARDAHAEAAHVQREAAKLATSKEDKVTHRELAAEHAEAAQGHRESIAELRATRESVRTQFAATSAEAMPGHRQEQYGKLNKAAGAATDRAIAEKSVESHYLAAESHRVAREGAVKAATAMKTIGMGSHEEGMAEYHDKMVAGHRAHAEAIMKGVKASAALDLVAYSPDQERGPDGRWAGGSGGAEAKAAIGRVLAGDRTAAAHAELLGHLGKLTTKDLNSLRKEHGLKASGRTKTELAAKLHDRLSRGRWTGEAALMSQADAANTFGPKIATEGKDYAKTAVVSARPAAPGEKVVTTTSDGKETENVAKAGDHVVTNPGGEKYVISGDKLASRYKDLGGGKYQATGSVRGVMHDGPETKISTTWGDTMPVKPGDMIVTPHGQDGKPTGEVYRIAKEEFKQTYSEKWGNKAVQPYYRPGANPTVDNVITRDNPKSGEREVLLIRRADKEGVTERGKWALPGGFHDTTAAKGEPWKPGHETAKEAAVRELKEETKLDASTLTEHLRQTGTYEGGGRDPRDNAEAWSKSTAFHLHLPPDLAKQVVRGQDDADKAKWIPLSQAKGLAFDHDKILGDALKSAPSARPATLKEIERIAKRG